MYRNLVLLCSLAILMSACATTGTFEGIKSTVFLEVEGAGHYLPVYAGNLDIMTSAALRTAEKIVERRRASEAA